MGSFVRIDVDSDNLNDWGFNCDMYLGNFKGINDPIIQKSECENIIRNSRKDVQLEEAIDVIIREMCDRKASSIRINVEDRDKSYAPPKEMTIEEIEKELGYKIAIIKGGSNDER